MAKGAQEIEQQFIVTAKEETGRNLDEWITYLKSTSLSKTNEIIAHIKSEFKLNHMQASMLAGIYLNDGKPVHDYATLFAKLFENRDEVMPIYEKVVSVIQSVLPDSVVLIPTKSYVSVEDERVFGCIKLNKANVRVGLDLERPFDETVIEAKGLGAMPNISHMVELTSADDINGRLGKLLLEAYNNRH